MRLLILFFLFPLFVISQKSKSDSTFEYKYFKNGKISTKRLLLSNKIHFGFLKAYKIDGTEIYSMSTRNIGGHCSVDVEYYPSGAIKKAHATDQPDGGIQHGDVTHYFDEEGNITNIVDLSDDGWGRTVTYPDFRKVDSPVLTPKIDKKPEVFSCAIIYSSEIFVVNLTRKPQSIISKKTPPNGIGFKEKTIVNPGDTVLLGGYYEAQLFTPASTVFSAEVELLKNKSNTFHFVWDNFIQASPVLRKYYLLLIDKKLK
jgi:hypothetical protein